MTERGARFAREESRPVRLRREGLLEVRPGLSAARLHRTRGWVVASGMVVCPLISGLFFGVVSGFLVLPFGGLDHATAIGALVGGIMLTSNAVALCIVHSSAHTENAARVQQITQYIDIREARAS